MSTTRFLSILLFTGFAFWLFITMSTVSASPPNLEVRITSSSVPATFSPPGPVSVSVSVRNNAPSPVTILNWGSPLDPRANVLGVFEIRDSETDELVTLGTIKFARKLPPSEEDLVQIPAGDSVEADVTLPLVPLVEGRQYTIQAKGRWHAVWERPRGELTIQNLEALSDAQHGDFSSDAVPIQIHSR